MEITSQMVKTLRDKTNAGMMDCKKALAECAGDLDKAVDWLRQKGLMTARKRAGRATREGLVLTAISADGRRGAIVELNTETDFVAKMDSFRELTQDIASYLAETDSPPKDLPDLLSRRHPQKGRSIAELIAANAGTTGENTRLRRYSVVQAQEGGFVQDYIHAGGRLAVLVSLRAEQPGEKADELAHNVAMQVAAANPLSIKPEELPPALVEKEKAIYRAKAQESGKPEKIWDNIIQGQLKKFYSEVALLEQPYVKEPAKTVAAVLKEAQVGQASVEAFARFQLGEEIEGEEDPASAEA
jgi:elongation factor Ts